MIAFHGDSAFRKRFLAEVKAHQDADAVMRGTYGEGRGKSWRGCAVGCSLHSLNRIKGRRRPTGEHGRYPTELGIPLELAHLEDRLFENMSFDKAMTWPLRFSSAIRTGADLSLVWPRFALWLLVDPEEGVIRFAKTDQQRTAIRGVAALFERQIGGQMVAREEWQNARSAAAYAAADAADAAAYAAADAAYAAADAAAYAAAAYAAAAARTRSFDAQADKLAELLRAAPVRRKR